MGERDLITIFMYILLLWNILNVCTPKVKLQPEDGPHAGPKHVVVSPMY